MAANRVIGLLLFIFFLVSFFLIPTQISGEGVPRNSPWPIYPQFFPYILAVLGCLLSLSLFVKSFLKSGSYNEDIEIPNKSSLVKIVLINVIISFYLVSFNLLGFLISTTLSLILFMAFLGLRDLKYFVLVGAGLPPLIYYLFKKLLYVSLPTGILGF